MRKVTVQFSSGDTDMMYSAAETDAEAANEVAGRILQALKGDWGWADKSIDGFVKGWYLGQRSAVASCGKASVKVER